MTPVENVLPLLLIGGAVYLMFSMFSRARRQQREAQQIQADLAVGADVMTTAGLYATVVELEDQAVVLETGPGQRSRWDRRAVARILPAESSPAKLDEPGEGAGTNASAWAAPAHDTADDGRAGTASSDQDTTPPERP